MGILLDELKSEAVKLEEELEEKSFNYWFDTNNINGCLDGFKSVMRNAYHFGWCNNTECHKSENEIFLEHIRNYKK